MCLAKAYLDEKERPFLEDVTSLRVEGRKLHLCNLFGETKELEASIREIDFQDSRILLDRQRDKR